MKRDILTPVIVFMGILAVILFLWAVVASGQTSKMPIKNGVLQSDLDAAGYKILGANMADYAGLNMTWNPTTGRFDASSGGGGSYQPLDADLTSIAALTTTTYGRSLLTLADAAAGRTSLALVIGTNVQAWDTDLDVWATKTPYAGTVTVTTGKTFNATGTLTYAGTDGSTLNIGSGGTLGTAAYTASTAYQAADSDLTTWAGVTPTSGIQTWLATPSSANLRGAVTDENGTGALLFSGATAPDFTTGFTIGAAAASGKIPIGNGTNYVPSTPTFSNAPSTALKWMRSDGTNWITSTSLLSDTPSTALKWLRSDGTNWITSTSTLAEGGVTAGKILISDSTNWTASTPTWPTASGAVGYTIRSTSTNFASYPAQLVNSSVSAQSPSTSDVYLAGSSIVVTAGDFKATGQYKCVFDMTKSAGTGAIVITLRVGTGSGAVGDAAIQTYTFGAGTSVADFGLFEVIATWRTVGSGTSAVMQGMCRGTHQLATTGLFNNAAGWMVLGSPSPSSGFNSNTATVIGLSFNGSTAFAGTTQIVQCQLQQ